MNLVQQLAEYQNAPLQTLEAAKRGGDPAISPWVAGAILSDRIEKQKRMQNAQGAAQGPQPTVSDQQDQEVSGIMSLQGAPQAPAAPQAAPQAPTMAAEGGLMQARVNPDVYEYSGGGIIAFAKGGSSGTEDDTIYDPVTGLPIAGSATQQGEDITLREALGLGNVENRRALEKAEREAKAPRVNPQAAELERLRADTMAGGAGKNQVQDPAAVAELKRRAAQAAALQAPPAGAPQAGAKPATGIMQLGPVQKAVTGSPEWATMEGARKQELEVPQTSQTPAAVAAERAAHLKAQGIEKAPWQTAAEQTAALRKLMGEEDAERKRTRAEKERDERFDTFVANLGPGSFGQSAQGGLRANLKRTADIEAEEQRIKQLRFDQNIKLNEIDRKAEELRYNEAVGDVAAAQKNREEIAKLKRDHAKDQALIAGKQAELRERAAASDLTAETTLKAAGMRAGAGQALTPKQIADIRDKANDNVKDRIKAGGVPLQLQLKKDPGMFDRLVAQETERLLAQYGGGGAPAPVQSPYGLPPQGAVRLKK